MAPFVQVISQQNCYAALQIFNQKIFKWLIIIWSPPPYLDIDRRSFRLSRPDGGVLKGL
jgi:hypothetical protein